MKTAQTVDERTDRADGAGVPEDERARKRQAIGLSPRRPTAPETVYRPPDAPKSAPRDWLAVGFLILLLALTVWMVLSVSGALGS